jgi:hypothetical protein
VPGVCSGQDAASLPSPSGRLGFAGEITGTFGPPDEGFFNYSDYEDSVLRLVTATLVGSFQVTDRIDALGELRLQNEHGSASGLYLSVRPWPGRAVAIQAGRIPPVFGRFGRRGYGRDNPLIGVPLAYQYLTTLRPTVVPNGVSPLLAVRGRGWLVSYPDAIGGDNRAGPGLPLVSSTRWDTGIQVSARTQTLGAAVAVTNGSLSNPLVGDDNGGKQVAGRVTWQPRAALELGLSLSRGAFLAAEATSSLPEGVGRDGHVQTAVGVDAEVSSGHWVVRGETIVSGWTLPRVGAPAIDAPLRTLATTLEGRYRFGPRLHVAARGERLTFSDLANPRLDGRLVPWDAPVSRLEVGAGYAVTRHLAAKLAWQYNWREGVTRPRAREGFLAAQVSAWF